MIILTYDSELCWPSIAANPLADKQFTVKTISGVRFSFHEHAYRPSDAENHAIAEIHRLRGRIRPPTPQYRAAGASAFRHRAVADFWRSVNVALMDRKQVR